MKFVNRHKRAAVGVIAWWLDLILHVQSLYITTNVVSSNPANGEVYSIKFVSDLRQYKQESKVHMAINICRLYLLFVVLYLAF
jgi:hypothetical protein